METLVFKSAHKKKVKRPSSGRKSLKMSPELQRTIYLITRLLESLSHNDRNNLLKVLNIDPKTLEATTEA